MLVIATMIEFFPSDFISKFVENVKGESRTFKNKR